MVVAWCRGGGGFDGRGRPTDKRVDEQLTVDEFVVGLVGVGQQAVVAGGFAVEPASGGAPDVVPDAVVVLDVVDAFERGTGNGGRRGWVLDQLAQDAGAPLEPTRDTAPAEDDADNAPEKKLDISKVFADFTSNANDDDQD